MNYRGQAVVSSGSIRKFSLDDNLIRKSIWWLPVANKRWILTVPLLATVVIRFYIWRSGVELSSSFFLSVKLHLWYLLGRSIITPIRDDTSWYSDAQWGRLFKSSAPSRVEIAPFRIGLQWGKMRSEWYTVLASYCSTNTFWIRSHTR